MQLDHRAPAIHRESFRVITMLIPRGVEQHVDSAEQPYCFINQSSPLPSIRQVHREMKKLGVRRRRTGRHHDAGPRLDEPLSNPKT